MSKYVPTFNNVIFDQLVTNKGSLNYCVRWDSMDKLSKSDVSRFEVMLKRQFKAWNQWLIDYDCWPYNEIDVKICLTACYKYQDQAKSSDTSACEGTPFDTLLWPTQHMDGGAGGDWGQRVNAENMLATLSQDQTVIVAHEIGHGFGIPDFYCIRMTGYEKV
ncbi:neutral zinc metallopeptidase [Phytophthora cinnamomi]|uniref:neutral zinc metallopeptidase n=1 Tax=Phytophthora cinnamomi TaxID=4785 RepID=UPI00355A68ED|nr:neutral zinc metallopeptidase [Phytophthora cinnamomi]